MRKPRTLFAMLSFVVLTSTSTVALATPEGDLAVAENAYAGLDYANASAKAEEVLAQRGLGHDVLVRATRVAALSHAALGHSEKSKEYFVLLLGYDPDFKVDTKLGPRFNEPFAEARGYWHAQGRKPSMDVQAVVQYGQAGQIRVVTVDPLGTIKRVSVAYRWAPARDYTNVSVEPGTRSVDIPQSPSGAGRFDYHVRALDSKDNAVFEEGSAEGPKTVIVNEPARGSGGGGGAAVGEEKKSIFGSPFFWGGAALVVAGAAVGGFFLLRPTDYSPSTTGRTAFGASCGGARCE